MVVVAQLGNNKEKNLKSSVLSRRVGVLAALFASGAFLAACGGGDSTSDTSTPAPSASVADNFAGSWARACLPKFYGAGTSSRDRLVLTKTADTTLAVSEVEDRYSNETCSGTPSTSTATPGTFVFGLSVTASGMTAYRIDASVSARTIKQLIAVSGSSLFVGNFESPKDSNGYPTTLELDPYKK